MTLDLDIKTLLHRLKSCRNHLIYVVFAMVTTMLFFHGVYWLVVVSPFFYFRFKKSWGLFLLVALLTFFLLFWVNQPKMMTDDYFEETLHTAHVLHVRNRRNNRQTALVRIEGQRVFLTYRDTYPLLTPGQQLAIHGQLRLPTSPTVPYRFDFPLFLHRQNVHLTLNTNQLTVTHTHFSLWRLQHTASQWIDDQFPPLTAAYLQALFIGVRDGMDEDMMSVYRELGMLHIFAISGVHVTLLAGLFKDALKRIGLVDVIVDIAVVCFCLFFILVAGGSISIIRASAMTSLALFNRRFKWGLSSFDIFAVVFIANFFLNPRIIYQTGFQYSYWISFILLCGRQSLKNLTPLINKISVVFLARMASLPLGIANNFDLNLTSFVANLLLVPLLMQLIFPALLIVLFIPPLAPLTELLLSLYESLNHQLLPFLNTNLIIGALPLSIVVVLLILLLIYCFLMEQQRKWWLPFLLIGAFVLVIEGHRLYTPYSTLTFLDVGQGDATVVRSPFHSCTVVIDTGGDVSRIRSENPSIFEQTLAPYLMGNGIRTIDFLILTHEHYDHIAETVHLMERFTVNHLIISEADIGQQMASILTVAAEKNIPVIQARPLDTFTCGNQQYTFVHGDVTHFDPNENSLVMSIAIDGFTTLITGDVGHIREETILSHNPLPRIDFYQVAHHGSRYSNSYDFLSALNISYAIVPVGRRNFYGHPHQELMDVTDALGIPLLSTAVHGTVSFRLRNGTYEIFVWPYGNFR